VRWEGENGVGSVPAIRCKVGIRRAAKSGVLEKQCIWIWGRLRQKSQLRVDSLATAIIGMKIALLEKPPQ
jgi:hypothetical protein